MALEGEIEQRSWNFQKFSTIWWKCDKTVLHFKYESAVKSETEKVSKTLWNFSSDFSVFVKTVREKNLWILTIFSEPNFTTPSYYFNTLSTFSSHFHLSGTEFFKLHDPCSLHFHNMMLQLWLCFSRVNIDKQNRCHAHLTSTYLIASKFASASEQA